MIAVHGPRGEVVHTMRTADDPSASCGIRIHPNRAGAPVRVRSAAGELGTTAGGVQLRWCGKCLGVLAVEAGKAEWLAAAVAAPTEAAR